jgi:predicted RNase H-like HicB family nuclease
MSPRRTYRVSAERTDRGWWVIRILDFRHVVTQARRAAEIETMARDVIALLEDLPPDSFDLDVTHRVGDDLDAGIAEARRLRREADDLTRRSRETTADVARRLRSAGLSVREIGALLGIAHQRAQQILATGDAAGRR